MRLKLLLTLVCMAFATCSLWAYDTEPDAKGMYDELYDRPTYFQDFVLTTKYPNNMTYITCARWGRNGDKLTNYEVAVYDQNNELRCIGRSITQDKFKCTLTIPGTEGETFHFKVLYGDDFANPTIVDVPQTCEFKTNDIVGHPDDGDPFWFTVPVDPKLLCWTTGLDGEANKTFSASDINSEEATTALASASRLHFFGNWETTDISTLKAGNPNLCYVNIDEAPIGIASAFTNCNPNCLFFFNESVTKAPEGITRNAIAGDKALTDIILQGGTASNYCPFFCPKDIDLNGHKAEFKRASWSWADGKSGWNTIVLPFDAQLTADGEVLWPYQYTNKIDQRYIAKNILGYWLGTITSAEDEGVTTKLIFETNTLTANHPYIISLPGERFYTQSGEVSTKQSISLQDKEIKLVSTSDVIPATPTELRVEGEDEYTSYPFTGTYQPLLGQPMYVLKNKAGANGLTAFVYGEKANLLPFQAYLNPSESQQRAEALTISLALDDSFMAEQTGIDGVYMDNKPLNGKRYSLGGRQLGSSSNDGIYIQNNKKYLSR